jgi:hypothetical protein
MANVFENGEPQSLNPSLAPRIRPRNIAANPAYRELCPPPFPQPFVRWSVFSPSSLSHSGVEILDGKDPEDFFSPILGALSQHPAGVVTRQRVSANGNREWCLRSGTTCPEKVIADLKGSFVRLLGKRQPCPDCIATSEKSAGGRFFVASGHEVFATEHPLAD